MNDGNFYDLVAQVNDLRSQYLRNQTQANLDLWLTARDRLEAERRLRLSVRAQLPISDQTVSVKSALEGRRSWIIHVFETQLFTEQEVVSELISELAEIESALEEQ